MHQQTRLAVLFLGASTCSRLLVGGESKYIPSMNATFSPESIKTYAENGKGSITGKVYYKFMTGEVKPAAANRVEIWPRTEYLKERFVQQVFYGEKPNLMEPLAKKTIRSCTTNEKGDFELNNLPPGDYFICCRVVWKSKLQIDDEEISTDGGVFAKAVRVNEDRQVDFDLDYSALVEDPMDPFNHPEVELYPAYQPSYDPLHCENAPKLVPGSVVRSAGRVLRESHAGDESMNWMLFGVQGDSVVEVWVDRDGMVQKAVTLWGPKEFRAIDQEGCFSNRYQPILENGEPIPFRFRTLMSRRSWDGGSIRPLPADWLAAVKG